jgi:ribosome-binding ATPase YchF (GTP1/OBG family)
LSKSWNKGVTLALEGPEKFTTITTIQEASWALIEDWPTEEGEALDRALIILEDAMKGKKSAEAARLAFIAAAHEAGIDIKE